MTTLSKTIITCTMDMVMLCRSRERYRTNLRARYCDPSMVRFLNKDTFEGQIVNPLSPNLYTYVENNPLIYSDHTGHITFKAGWYISRGSQDYLINSTYKSVKSLFSPSTYKSV
ncbi:RHS repeat-associated core domain-containing protein [Paenibacillus sp. FSL R7-0302]|uniref:RHS repeat-associated core domain-containing protein n=1 Tax=Paenibacillus sp. FSL R7-0302 TaxID=2921681 RepID=UPI0030F56614